MKKKNPRGRNSQVARIFAIFEILAGAPQGLSIREIHGKVSERGHRAAERTIYRDLDALQLAGFPIHSSEDAGEDRMATIWSVDKTARINEYLVLSPTELLALYLARGALAPLRHSPIYQDLEAVFKKIEGKIGKRNREYLEELTDEVLFNPWPQWGLGLKSEVLNEVRAACAEHHVLEVEYQSVNGGDRRKRRLGPQFLYFLKSSIYLIAEDLESNSIKTFALPRILSAQMTELPYDGKTIDPEYYFQSGFGLFQGDLPVQVRVKFSKEVASYVRERSWHPTQQIEAGSDGTITLRLRVAITPDLLNWVTGFGVHAVVLEPPGFRSQLVETIGNMLKQYEEKQAA